MLPNGYKDILKKIKEIEETIQLNLLYGNYEANVALYSQLSDLKRVPTVLKKVNEVAGYSI